MQRLQRQEDRSSELERNLSKEFVHKDDYRNDIKEIKDILKQIFDKLDAKADK